MRKESDIKWPKSTAKRAKISAYLFDSVCLTNKTGYPTLLRLACNRNWVNNLDPKQPDFRVWISRSRPTSYHSVQTATPIRVLVAKAVRDAGMEVHYTGLRKTPESILLVLGGTIPQADIPARKEIGLAEVFGPGTTLDAVVDFLHGRVKPKTADLQDR